jgi:hypothetical protein
MYYFSPGARGSLRSYKLSSGGWMDSGLVFFPFARPLTLPFIVQGGLLYRGTKGRKEEVERETS